MKHVLRCGRYLTTIPLCLWLSLPASAQLCRIRGTVTDSRQAAVAAAVVTVIQVNSGLIHQVLSNAHGRFQLMTMPPGEYRVEAAKPGFKPLPHTRVTLGTGLTAVLDLHMEDAQAAETTERSLVAYVCGLSPGSGCEMIEPTDAASELDVAALGALEY
jgi:hypothetical protein